MYACAYPENYLVWTISETTFYDFNYVTPKTEDKNTHNKQQQSFSTHKNAPATPKIPIMQTKNHAFPNHLPLRLLSHFSPCLWHPPPHLKTRMRIPTSSMKRPGDWQDFGDWQDPKVRFLAMRKRHTLRMSFVLHNMSIYRYAKTICIK